MVDMIDLDLQEVDMEMFIDPSISDVFSINVQHRALVEAVLSADDELETWGEGPSLSAPLILVDQPGLEVIFQHLRKRVLDNVPSNNQEIFTTRDVALTSYPNN